MNLKNILAGTLMGAVAFGLGVMHRPEPEAGSYDPDDWRARMPDDVRMIARKEAEGRYCYPMEMGRLSAWMEENPEHWNDFCEEEYNHNKR